MAADSKDKRLVSIVTPVMDEEMNVRPFHEAVSAVLEPLRDAYDVEFVFTDNHSSDRTFEILREMAAADPRIRVYRFSRNFGYQKSIYTGYMKARGDAAVQLDCDLQDPPELIPEFLNQWESGYKVVYGIRRTRVEGWAIHSMRRFFYRLIDALSPDDLPPDAGDFRLIDRRIIEELRRVRDPNIYIRGRIAAMGFRQIGIPYDRRERARGRTKFSFSGLVGLSMDAFLSHSVLPLKFATFIGLLAIAAAVLGILLVFVGAAFGFKSNWPPGFATITVLLLFNIGVVCLFLGIIGEYLARIYQQLKQSPDPIIEDRIGSEDA